MNYPPLHRANNLLEKRPMHMRHADRRQNNITLKNILREKDMTSVFSSPPPVDGSFCLGGDLNPGLKDLVL
jgi:hypothetical protein